MDEADKVEQQISALQDRMVDISLTLHASMRCLAEAKDLWWNPERGCNKSATNQKQPKSGLRE